MASLDDIKSRVEESIVTDPNRSFEDVCGLNDLKALFKDLIISPLKTGSMTSPYRILLCGAPGTGKSFFLRSLVREISPIPLYVVYCFDLVGWAFSGNDEAACRFRRELFQHASSQDHGAILLFEELETICMPHYTFLWKELSRDLVELAANVVVIFVSQRPWTVPAEFLQVFNKVLYTPLPDRNSRISFLNSHLKDVQISEEEFGMLADLSEGFTGADIVVFIRDALNNPVKEYMRAKYFVERDGKMIPCDADTEGCVEMTANSILDLPNSEEKVWCRPLCLSDVQECLSRARPSTDEDDMARFEEFTKEFVS